MVDEGTPLVVDPQVRPAKTGSGITVDHSSSPVVDCSEETILRLVTNENLRELTLSLPPTEHGQPGALSCQTQPSSCISRRFRAP